MLPIVVPDSWISGAAVSLALTVRLVEMSRAIASTCAAPRVVPGLTEQGLQMVIASLHEYERTYLLASIADEFQPSYTWDLFSRFVAERDALEAELAREQAASTGLLEAAQRMERERDELRGQLADTARASSRAADAAAIAGNRSLQEIRLEYLARAEALIALFESASRSGRNPLATAEGFTTENTTITGAVRAHVEGR